MSIDTVNDLPPRVQYVATASQTVFPYPFPIFQDADLVVEAQGIVQTLTTHYAVSGEGDDTGGNVTFVTGRSAGDVITIYRQTVIERDSDFQLNGPMFSTSVNDELDKLTIIAQEQRAATNRCLRIPMNAEVDDADIELGPISAWFNKYLAFDADGRPEPAELVSGTISQSVIGGLLYPQTGFEANGTVTRAWYPPGDIRRYGATDGADSTAAIAAAIAQMNAGGADVYIPTGTWHSSTSHRVTYAGWRIIGDDCVRSIVRFTGTGANGGFIIGGDPGVAPGNGGNFGYMRGIGLYNGGTVSNAIILYNAGGSSFYNVFVGGASAGFASHGFLIDENYLSPKGNNNNARFFNCTSQLCTGSGFAWLLPGSDQNAIELHACNGSFNAGHGLLLKGQANRVVGGIFEGNGGYGIRIGNDSEGISTRSIIWFPYLESNTSGGVGGSNQTFNNQIYLDGLNANSSYTKSAGAENFWWEPSNSSGPYVNMGDPECYLRAHMITSGGTRLSLSAQGSTTNLQMQISGKGTGGLHFEPGNDATAGMLRFGQQGSTIRNILRGSVNFGANTVANVSFGVTLPNTNYIIVLGPNANKTFWWSGKATTGFVMNASAVSSDTVDWMVISF